MRPIRRRPIVVLSFVILFIVITKLDLPILKRYIKLATDGNPSFEKRKFFE